MDSLPLLAWWLLAGLAALAAAALTTLWRIARAGRSAEPRRADAILVFGAGVGLDGPSLTMLTRVECAARLYGAGLAPLIFCCGGRSGATTEARVMRALLLDRGVPAGAVIPDDHGSSTRRALGAAKRSGRGRWRRIIAVSSPYHLYRIAQEGRRQGLALELCAARRSGPSTWRHAVFDARQHLREMLAVWAYAASGAVGPRLRAALPVRAVRQVWARLQFVAGAADEVAATSDAIGLAIKSRVVGSPESHTVHTPASGLRWPAPGVAGSRFGMRHGRIHGGVDLRAALGSPVQAAADGYVVLADWLGPYGNVVAIHHGGGLATVYAHLGGFLVAEEEPVKDGQLIGFVGETGRGSGPHLHFEVRVHGSAVDPLAYLPDPGRLDVHQRHGQHNAVWAESIYLRGHDPKKPRRVLDDRELERFAERLVENGVRYAYLFAGPFDRDGGVPEYASSASARESVRKLRRLAPDLVLLPWVGGLQYLTVRLDDARWVDRAVEETARLIETLEVAGTHLDFELILPSATAVLEERNLPATGAGVAEYGSWHVAFHARLRERLPGAFLSAVIPSTASPVEPWKGKHTHLEAGALACEVDQLALLHYDTSIADRATFVASLEEQLRHIADWKARPASARTQYLIGAGTFVNARPLRRYRHLEVEGLPHLLSALEQAIAGVQQATRLVDGLAIFCDWTTSRRDWRELRQSWTVGAH